MVTPPCPVCGSYEARAGAWPHATQCLVCGAWYGVSLQQAGLMAWRWPAAAVPCPTCGCFHYWKENPYTGALGCVQCGTVSKDGKVIRYGLNLDLPLDGGAPAT